MTPRALHRTAALLEMGTWALLILSMILKYSGTTAALTPIAGGIHGFGFLCFVVMTVVVWTNNRWPVGIGIAGLVVSLIPFAALPFALWVDKKGLLESGWRFRDGQAPHGPAEHLLAQLVRHPVRTLVILGLILCAIFALLLTLGPPVDVESAIESRR